MERRERPDFDALRTELGRLLQGTEKDREEALRWIDGYESEAAEGDRLQEENSRLNAENERLRRELGKLRSAQAGAMSSRLRDALRE